MTEDKKPTTADHLRLICAGLLQRPALLDDVRQYLGENIIAECKDPVVTVIWPYLLSNPEPTMYGARSAMILAGVALADALAFSECYEQAVHEKNAQLLSNARNLSRAIVNMKRAAFIKEASDKTPPHLMDFAATVLAAERTYPQCEPVSMSEGNLAGLCCSDWTANKQVGKLRTGFKSLDSHCGGLDIGYPTAVVGRSGQGKTTMLQALALALLCPGSASYEHRLTPKRCVVTTKKSRPFVLFLSVEMTRDDMISRFISSLLLINQSDLNNSVDAGDAAAEAEWEDDADSRPLPPTGRQRTLDQHGERFTKLMKDIEAHARFTLMDAELLKGTSPQLIIAAIEGWASSIRKKYGAKARLFVALDYLQYLIDETAGDDKQRYEVVQAAMRAVKDVTTKYSIATVVGLQAGDGKHPTCRGDIRASKAVIDDCSAVWLIRREEVVPEAFNNHCQKARFGPENWTAAMLFDGTYMMLTDGDPSAPAPPSPAQAAEAREVFSKDGVDPD